MIRRRRLSIRSKVCGLTRPDDAQYAIEMGADALGVVAVPRSPRYLDPQSAHAVFACATTQAKVLVVCDASPVVVREWVQLSQADVVQLCGQERPQAWADFPTPILRRVGVDESGLREIDVWRPLASAFVLDHPSSPGGSGETVDFATAKTLASFAPCLLAGGLNPENVAEAIAQVHPMGVDASSGLEQAPGIKDPDKILNYLKAARAALTQAEQSS